MNKTALIVLVVSALCAESVHAIVRPSALKHSNLRALEETGGWKEKARKFLKNQAYVHIGGFNDDIGKCAPSGPYGYWLGNSEKQKLVLTSAPFMSGPKSDFRKFLSPRAATVLLDLVETISKLGKSKPKSGYQKAIQSQLCHKEARLGLNRLFTQLRAGLNDYCDVDHSSMKTTTDFKKSIRVWAGHVGKFYEMYWHEYNVEGGQHEAYMEKTNRWPCGASSMSYGPCMEDDLSMYLVDLDHSLHFVPRNRVLWEDLKKFAKSEWSAENVLAAEDLAKLFASISDTIPQQQKTDFYNNYLSDTAPNQLNTNKKNTLDFVNARTPYRFRMASAKFIHDIRINLADTFSRYRLTPEYEKMEKELSSC